MEDSPEDLRDEVKRLREALALATMDLESLLRLRGFSVFSKEPSDDLLVPAKRHLDGFYGMMAKYSFRLFLRDVIKHQEMFTEGDVTRYATAEATGDFIDYIVSIGLAERTEGGYRLKRKYKSFGSTLEWFMAETLRREFGAEALWGVKFKGKRAAGDYDLIARADGLLLYMEVKSSPPKQVMQGEVEAFLGRAEAVAADVSVFFMDTELRMKDKIVPMFEEALGKAYASPPAVERMERELFQVAGRLFIINSKNSVAGNMGKVITWHFRDRYPLRKEA